MLSFRMTTFLLSKDGEPQYRCEDAAATDPGGLRFAIADGATEGFDSKRWARYITKAWVSPSTARLAMHMLPERLRLLGDRQSERWVGRQLPWYVEEKSRDGAFAAFLGLDLRQAPTWTAIAIGDCCLFIERKKSLIESFPLSSPEQFGTRPTLVPSMVLRYPDYIDALQKHSGCLRLGDRLLLMSDAIACWYLKCWLEEHTVKNNFADAVTSHDTKILKEIIASERNSKELRNDDVAIICLEITSI